MHIQRSKETLKRLRLHYKMTLDTTACAASMAYLLPYKQLLNLVVLIHRLLYTHMTDTELLKHIQRALKLLEGLEQKSSEE